MLNESDLERYRELIKCPASDLAQLTQWAAHAKEALIVLTDLAERSLDAAGGTLGARIRQAVEPRIVAELNGRAALGSGVSERSLTVTLAGKLAYVDIRLQLDVVP